MAQATVVVIAFMALSAGPAAAGDFSFSSWAVARFDHLPGGGSATSVVSYCDGGVNDAGTCDMWSGYEPDTARPQATVQFKRRPPGEVWRLEIYDAGSCDGDRHVLLVLPPVRIGSDGRRTSRLLLDEASASIVNGAVYRDGLQHDYGSGWTSRLRLRLSTDSLVTCARYTGWMLGQ